MSLKNSNAKIKIPKLFKDKLKNKRINRIYKNFEKSLKIDENFIVGVSGGPDSLALAFLAKIYSIKKKIESKFVIIDHKLRKESSKEAKSVQKILKKFHIVSKILIWKGKKPDKNIQSLARQKRYNLLINYCKRSKFKNILLGHHQDDLFENFFIRILRGSGLKGLVSLNEKNQVENINILRPLLSFKKEDLIFLSKIVFNFYVKDPSNENVKFKRIKIRKLLFELEKDGLNKNKFLKTIGNLKHSDTVLNYYVNNNLINNSYFSKKNKKLFLNKDFFEQPFEVIFRSFSDSIKKIGENYYSSRGKKLEKMIFEIKKNSSFKATLGKCVIEKVNQTVIISKEH